MTIPTTNATRQSSIAVVVILCWAALAAAQPSPGSLDSLQSLVRRLQSASADERKAALVDLRSQRVRAIEELMRIVANERSTKSGKPDTALHLAILTLGEWNAAGVQPLLLEMIDFRLDLDAGAKYPLGYEYPAAYALTLMSPRAIAGDVTTRLAAETTSPLRRRLMVWTLYRLLGEAGAREVLESARKRLAGDALDRIKKAQDELRLGDRLISRLPQLGRE